MLRAFALSMAIMETSALAQGANEIEGANLVRGFFQSITGLEPPSWLSDGVAIIFLVIVLVLFWGLFKVREIIANIFRSIMKGCGRVLLWVMQQLADVFSSINRDFSKGSTLRNADREKEKSKKMLTEATRELTDGYNELRETTSSIDDRIEEIVNETKDNLKEYEDDIKNHIVQNRNKLNDEEFDPTAPIPDRGLTFVEVTLYIAVFIFICLIEIVFSIWLFAKELSGIHAIVIVGIATALYIWSGIRLGGYWGEISRKRSCSVRLRYIWFVVKFSLTVFVSFIYAKFRDLFTTSASKDVDDYLDHSIDMLLQIIAPWKPPSMITLWQYDDSTSLGAAVLAAITLTSAFFFGRKMFDPFAKIRKLYKEEVNWWNENNAYPDDCAEEGIKNLTKLWRDIEEDLRDMSTTKLSTARARLSKVKSKAYLDEQQLIIEEHQVSGIADYLSTLMNDGWTKNCEEKIDKKKGDLRTLCREARQNAEDSRRGFLSWRDRGVSEEALKLAMPHSTGKEARDNA